MNENPEGQDKAPKTESPNSEGDTPSVDTLVRVVIYIGLLIVIGTSFGYSLKMINTEFAFGIGYTLVNILLLALLGRYVWNKHAVDRGF